MLLTSQLAHTLSPDERVRAGRFRFERDRRRFVTRRGLLRRLLNGYVGIDPSRLQLGYGAAGKPVLAQISGRSKLRFNLSHSGGLALYAFTLAREVGIDLERTRPVSEAETIAGRFFSTGERKLLRGLPRTQQQEAFLNCWTRKEACLKATGVGFGLPPERIEVSLAPGQPARLLSIDGDPQEAARWCLQNLTPAPGYVAALVVEGHGWRLARRQWPDGGPPSEPEANSVA
jgi:4'-phosphopantetheinyl transferase